jgi:hypothetical protein
VAFGWRFEQNGKVRDRSTSENILSNSKKCGEYDQEDKDKNIKRKKNFSINSPPDFTKKYFGIILPHLGLKKD